jgi:hypothetical protein
MRLTVGEAVTLVPVIGWIIGRSLLALIFGPLRRGKARTRPWLAFAMERAVHAVMKTPSARQLQ